MLYSFSQLAVQRKYDLPATWETLKSVLRSSLFIFFHAYNGSVMGCALRNGFGRFYYRVLVCAPALISSYLSLIIEKPSRRQALAFYLLNMASEIVYRMAVTKGYFKPVRHGETLLFALSLGAWYNLIKSHGFGHDPVSAIVKTLIGREEAKSRASSARASQAIQQSSGDEERRKVVVVPNCDSQSAFSKLNSVIDRLGKQHFGANHATCPHYLLDDGETEEKSSCLLYVLQPIPTRFLLGYTIQSLLKLASKPYLLLTRPQEALYASFASGQSLKFGLFLVGLVSTGRLTNCLFRRHFNSNSHPCQAFTSGFLAGLSMLLAPRSSLAMYIMWKAVEQYYLMAAGREENVLTRKYFNFTILTIYSCSAATILYTFALEPRFVRPSYMKFLDNLSDHRLHQLNRMVLDVFGTGSSVGYEDFFPDLDPKFMSNQFKELIFNWMIQPYE